MAKGTVTLVRANPESNPHRRRHRRARRNPNLLAAVQKPFPDLTLAASALLGAGVALALPRMFKATRWTNVAWSLGAVVLGTAALKMAKAGDKATTGYAIGGTVMALAKALHVGSGGKFGLDPSTRFEGLPEGMPGNAAPPIPAAASQVMLNAGTAAPNEVPHMNYETTGIVRPVGGFKNSDYDGMGEEPLNV